MVGFLVVGWLAGSFVGCREVGTRTLGDLGCKTNSEILRLLSASPRKVIFFKRAGNDTHRIFLHQSIEWMINEWLSIS